MTDQPDPAQPDPAQLDPAQPDPAQPDPAQPDPALPDPEPPDAQTVRGPLVANGFNAQDDHSVEMAPLCDLVLDVLSGEGVVEGQVDLHLVDAATMHELNAEHMGVDRPTDVLAFPLEDDPFAPAGDEPPMLGDLVICPAVAVTQAPEHTGSTEAEFSLLVIHGVLHLLGHDHAEADETLVMQSRERHYLDQRGFAHPVQPPAAPQS